MEEFRLEFARLQRASAAAEERRARAGAALVTARETFDESCHIERVSPGEASTSLLVAEAGTARALRVAEGRAERAQSSFERAFSRINEVGFVARSLDEGLPLELQSQRKKGGGSGGRRPSRDQPTAAEQAWLEVIDEVSKVEGVEKTASGLTAAEQASTGVEALAASAAALGKGTQGATAWVKHCGPEALSALRALRRLERSLEAIVHLGHLDSATLLAPTHQSMQGLAAPPPRSPSLRRHNMPGAAASASALDAKGAWTDYNCRVGPPEVAAAPPRALADASGRRPSLYPRNGSYSLTGVAADDGSDDERVMDASVYADEVSFHHFTKVKINPIVHEKRGVVGFSKARRRDFSAALPKWMRGEAAAGQSREYAVVSRSSITKSSSFSKGRPDGRVAPPPAATPIRMPRPVSAQPTRPATQPRLVDNAPRGSAAGGRVTQSLTT